MSSACFTGEENCYLKNCPFTFFRGNFKSVSIGAYIWKAHPGTESHFPHLGRGSGVTLLHCQGYVGNARSLIRQFHVYLFRVQVYEYDSTPCMRYDIHLCLIKTYHNTLDNVVINIKLLQHLLDLARGVPCMGEIATLNLIFETHCHNIQNTGFRPARYSSPAALNIVVQQVISGIPLSDASFCISSDTDLSRTISIHPASDISAVRIVWRLASPVISRRLSHFTVSTSLIRSDAKAYSISWPA